MLYNEFCQYLQSLENTSSRNKMTEILIDFFQKINIEDVKYAISLLKGQLHNNWESQNEINLAGKMALTAMSSICSYSKEKLEIMQKEIGDIGDLAEQVLKKKIQKTLFSITSKGVQLQEVYDTLIKISNMSGGGSNKNKIEELTALYSKMTPLESKFLTKFVVRTYRLGFQDATILDALAILYLGDKKKKEVIERAYNFRPDLVYIIETLMKGEDVEKIKPSLFIPIRMMLAQRLESSKQILENHNGKTICEFKYDGVRLQIHKKGKRIEMYSRGLEEITHQFPEIKKAVLDIPIDNLIIEGEVCAVNDIDEIQKFQVTARRKRKHDIDRLIDEIPVKIFLFDILYCDDEIFIDKPFTLRREKLEEIIKENNILRLANSYIIQNVDDLQNLFFKAVEENTEGLMCKKLDSKYSAGTRGSDWIKLKASYQSQLQDSIDVVCIGALKGSGKRTGKYASIVVGTYNKITGKYESLSKVGSGFADSVLNEMNIKFKILNKKPDNVVAGWTPDFWFLPEYVMEIIGDEFTLSPSYSCAKDTFEKGRGISLRFPRFKKWRDDKNIIDATTTQEIIEMYKLSNINNGGKKNE